MRGRASVCGINPSTGCVIQFNAPNRPGRQDALKHALAANIQHGQRRTNADKRRCVEVALVEFSTLSSRAIAELCGVSHRFVDGIRPQVATVATSTRIGRDGKPQAAKRTPKAKDAAVVEF